ncbi:uncharacterized protein LOC143477083 [Brachyhypopomus gauderio]|uniref:uncharacterized protein LOC143477083 n=1 Tax=Brachyhypopomus gauderio TaxID=698409 RepID=UPI004042F4A2
MMFPLPFLGIGLRPVVLCATGVSAAAVSSFLVYRWWVRDRQRTQVEAGTHADPCHGHDGETFPMDEDIFEMPHSPIRESRRHAHQALHRAHRVYAFTFSQTFSSATKVVEVTLQHKSAYKGQESEHWWVLNNAFYNIDAELTLHYCGNAKAVAWIKRKETSITEATIYLCTQSTTSSVQNIFLQKEVSVTYKGVSIDSDGLFRLHESNHTQTLETPDPAVFSTSPDPPRGPPPRPPPGF